MVILPRILHGSNRLLEIDAPARGMTAADFLTGMAITAVLPATIWCAMLALAGLLFQLQLEWHTFATVGATIATFLAAIYTCLVRQSS